MAVFADVQRALPYLKVPLSESIVDAMELKNTSIAIFDKGKPQMMNSKGARQVVEIQTNPAYGYQPEGGFFREAGSHKAVEYLIGFSRFHISGGVNGDYFANISKQSIGPTIAMLIGRDLKVLKRQLNIEFCHGTGLGQRGKLPASGSNISVTAGVTTVTFDGEEGTRFLDVGATYFVHDPVAGTQRCSTVTNGFDCTSITDTTHAVFNGDMTSGASAVANGDIFVFKATVDNQSSFNRALFGFEYFFGNSGMYFGLSKDTIDKIRGIKIDGTTDNVNHGLLQKGITRFKYRWNEDAVDSFHVDFIPPAQEAAYMLLGYPLRRVQSDDAKYDGAFKTVTDGNRTMVIDAHIRPSNWFRVDKNTIFRYPFKEIAVWDLDGLQMRAPQGSGSIQDRVFWVLDGKGQYACINPARNVWYFNLGTSGVDTGV